MSSGKRTGSGSKGDERYAMMDEKKRKRMISNRESSRRSRMKKDLHMKDLNNQLSKMVQENKSLRAQLAELSNKVESLEMVLRLWAWGVRVFNSMSVSQGPLNGQWQVPPQSFLLMGRLPF